MKKEHTFLNAWILGLLLTLFPASLLRAQWTTHYTGPNVFDVEAVDDTTWYLSEYYVLKKSTDEGASFTTLIPYMLNNAIEGMHVMGNTHVWLAGYSSIGGTHGWINYSTNGGSNWTGVTTPGSGYYLTDVYFTTTANGVATSSQGGIYRSTNGGASWTQVHTNSGNLLRRIAFSGTSNGVAVGNNGQVIRTTNGGASWTAQVVSSNSTTFEDVKSDGAGNFLIGGSNGAYRSSNNGQTWTQVLPNIIQSVEFAPGGVAYAGGMADFYKSTDNGITWLGVNGHGGYSSTNIFFRTATTGYVTDPGHVYKTTNGVVGCPTVTTPDTLIVCGDTAQLVATPSANNPYLYVWTSLGPMINTIGQTVYGLNPVPGQQDTVLYAVALVDTFTNCFSTNSSIVVIYDTNHFIPSYTQPTNIITVCQGDSVYISPGIGGSSYQWSGTNIPNGFTGSGFWTDTTTMCWVTVTDACGTYGYVLLAQLTTDCDSVWPGDASYNGVADMYDLLNVGVAFSSSGTPRVQQDNLWYSHFAQPWNQSFVNIGGDYKHADSDGNGTVGYSDTTAILLNYGLTHVVYPLSGGSFGPNDPPLYFGTPPLNVGPGDTLVIPVYLGNANIPANGFYGGVFSVNYDSNYIKPNSVRVTFNPCWMGTVNTNALALYKNLPSAEKVDIGICRNNQQNVSGYGEIAQLGFVMQDDISAKYDPLEFLVNAMTSLTFSGEKFINIAEQDMPVNPLPSDITIVLDEMLESQEGVRIFPNPSADLVYITGEVNWITVADIQGKTLLRFSNTQSFSMQNLPSGIYQITWEGAHGKIHHEKLVHP